MIKITDRYNLMPELFQLYPEHFQRCHSAHGDVDMLGTYDRDAPASDRFTIVVSTEPDDRVAHTEFADLLQRRPHSVWMITSRTPGVEWQVGQTQFLPMNLIMTTRNNDPDQSWQVAHKPRLATALLGGWGRERSVLFDALRRERLLDQCLVNYRRRPGQEPDPNWADLAREYQSPEIVALDDHRFQSAAYQQGGLNSMVPADFATYQQGWISMIVPWRIYDQSWLNLVAETGTHGFLPSEKIAKPLLAGQPWLVLGCQHFLQQLKELGFRTFHPLIDESYDEHGSYRARIAAIVHELRKFNQLPDQEKLRRVQDMQPILDHNRRLMLDQHHWYAPVRDCILRHA